MRKYLIGEYIDNKVFEDINIRKENDLILGLRLIDGIDYFDFNKRYNTSLLDNDIISLMINDGKLDVCDRYLRCNDKYIYLLNDILIEIIGSDL